MNIEQSFDAVILANGEFPTHPCPLSLLRDAPFLCCCDGAALTAVSHGLKPDAVVGDGDSLSADMKEKLGDIFHHVSEQEDNDLTKATRFCLSKGFGRIAYVGASGKREDHAIANIFLMERYARVFHMAPLLFTDTGIFSVAHSGDNMFHSFPRQQVSIFNVSCSRISSNGLRWNSYPYTELWQGTLNESLGKMFSLQTDGTCLVFQTYNAK